MPTELTIGTFTPSVLLATADRSGLLADAGLALREQPVTSSPDQFRRLLAGELDLALTSPDNVVAYRFVPGNPLGRLADVRIVSTVDRGTGLGLYARPGVTAADLRTSRVGVDVPTSGFAIALYAIAEVLDVGRDDLDLVALGSTPRRLTALLAGDCDATMLNAGNELLAEDAGCGLLGRLTDHHAPYCSTVLAVAGERRLEDAHRVAETLRTTARAILSGAARAIAHGAAKDVLGLPDALAYQFVRRFADRDQGLIVDADPDLQALRTVVDLRRQYLPVFLDGSDPFEGALELEAGMVSTRPVPNG